MDHRLAIWCQNARQDTSSSGKSFFVVTDVTHTHTHTHARTHARTRARAHTHTLARIRGRGWLARPKWVSNPPTRCNWIQAVYMLGLCITIPIIHLWCEEKIKKQTPTKNFDDAKSSRKLFASSYYLCTIPPPSSRFYFLRQTMRHFSLKTFWFYFFNKYS